MEIGVTVRAGKYSVSALRARCCLIVNGAATGDANLNTMTLHSRNRVAGMQVYKSFAIIYSHCSLISFVIFLILISYNTFLIDHVQTICF